MTFAFDCISDKKMNLEGTVVFLCIYIKKYIFAAV